MVEGRETYEYKNPVYDDNDGDDDDDYEINTAPPDGDSTWAFEPGEASTPHNGGEQYEMQTRMHEQSGLPDTSYEEEPLLRRTGSIGDLQKESALRQKMKKSVDMIKAKFPRANFDAFKIRRGSGKNAGKIVAIGSRGGEYKILKDDESDLTKSFFDSFKKNLGTRAEEILIEDRNTIQEQRQRLTEAENQQRLANALAAEKEKEEQGVENLRQQVERIQARIDGLQEEQGSNLESEAELKRLKQLKKIIKKILIQRKKKAASLEKEAKNKEKAQARVDREREKLAQIEKERNEIEERLNSTKALDELKERQNALKRQNEEDQKIIQDENTSPSEREAAEERVAERTEELDRLHTQIGERESAMPLRERVRQIFKEHGVTVTAILLAAGATIAAVIGTITNALKKLGTELGNGLKAFGAKAASALPGLIGAIVNFLFKAAGSAIGFLAEHTWLLILAVVAFLFQKLMKKN